MALELNRRPLNANIHLENINDPLTVNFDVTSADFAQIYSEFQASRYPFYLVENQQNLNSVNQQNLNFENQQILNFENQQNLDAENQPNQNIENDRITRLQNSNIYYYENQPIGSGATSIVYRGYHSFPRRVAAVKRVIIRNGNSVRICERELHVWGTMQHMTMENLNVVQLFGYYRTVNPTATCYYFAMELATTDLERRIQEFKATPEDPCIYVKLKGYLHDAAKGLNWLHSQSNPIIHRDIKPHNILIFISATNTEIAKLGDFGISRRLNNSSTGTNTSVAGSSDWMTPEAIVAMCNEEDFRNTTSMDIFNLGMVFNYAFTLGEHPFKIRGTFIPANISNPLRQPNKLADIRFISANHLSLWMMSKQSSQRPNIKQVLHHCFFYSNKKCLEFIVDVAKSLANKRFSMERAIQNKIDIAFERVYCKLRNQEKVDWVDDLGYLFFKKLSRPKCSGRYFEDTYYDNCGKGMALVFLIRDKYLHYTDVVDQLAEREEFFGERENERLQFSESKYTAFFLNKFPELVPVLWSTIATDFEDSEYPILGPVKSKYNLYQFKTMPKLIQSI